MISLLIILAVLIVGTAAIVAVSRMRARWRRAAAKPSATVSDIAAMFKARYTDERVAAMVERPSPLFAAMDKPAADRPSFYVRRPVANPSTPTGTLPPAPDGHVYHAPTAVIADLQRLGETERAAEAKGYLLGLGHGLRVAATVAGLPVEEPPFTYGPEAR
jgi:hypothetical protein